MTSPFLERVGPLFDFPEARRKLRIVRHKDMRGDSEFNFCCRWNPETKVYDESKDFVRIREGDIYDAILVEDGDKGIIVGVLALQMHDVIATIKHETYLQLTSEEKSRETSWFWLQEV